MRILYLLLALFIIGCNNNPVQREHRSYNLSTEMKNGRTIQDVLDGALLYDITILVDTMCYLDSPMKVHAGTNIISDSNGVLHLNGSDCVIHNMQMH